MRHPYDLSQYGVRNQTEVSGVGNSMDNSQYRGSFSSNSGKEEEFSKIAKCDMNSYREQMQQYEEQVKAINYNKPGGIKEQTTSIKTRKPRFLGIAIFVTITLVLFIIFVFFVWKPFTHEEQNTEVDVTTYKNPIVYVHEKELYLCDEDGSKKECLSEEAYQDGNLSVYNNRAKYLISDDKRYIVYPKTVTYSGTEERTNATLCIYDLWKRQTYNIGCTALDYRITPENYLLLQIANDNKLYWVNINQLEYYENVSEDKDSAEKEIYPESAILFMDDYGCNIDESFISQDGTELIIIGERNYNVKYGDLVNYGNLFDDDPVYGENNMPSRYIVSSFNLGRRMISREWGDVHSYSMDLEKREMYFLSGNELVHLESDSTSSTMSGVVYFYWDSRSDYLMYLNEHESDPQSIKVNDLVEVGEDEVYDEQLMKQEVFQYGVYQMTIDYQDDIVTYSDIKVNPNYITVDNGQVLTLKVKRDEYKKISRHEYEALSLDMMHQTSYELIYSAFYDQCLIGTKLYKKSELEVDRILEYDKEKNQIMVIKSIEGLDKGGELYQKIMSEGYNGELVVIYVLDLYFGRIVDYYLYDSFDTQYYAKLGDKPLAYCYMFENNNDQPPATLYYGTKVIEEEVLPHTIWAVKDKEFIYLANYQKLLNSSDMYYCDENGQTILIDTNVIDYWVTNKNTIFYCKNDGISNSQLFRYQDGKSISVNQDAEILLKTGVKITSSSYYFGPDEYFYYYSYYNSVYWE